MIVLAIGTVGMSALLLLTTANSIARGAIAVGTIVVLTGYFTLDAKFWGVVLMGASVTIIFALPWLDHSPVRSMLRYRPTWHFWLLIGWAVNFFALGYLGTQPPNPSSTLVAQTLTLVYFHIICDDAVVEHDGFVQARPGPRYTFATHEESQPQQDAVKAASAVMPGRRARSLGRDCFPATSVSAIGGGFNSSLQQLHEIVELAFRSAASFSVVR